MKQFYTFILMLLLTATSAMAQKADNTHVSVRCGDTPLESLLTDGQKQAVTHLTVTGVLLDEDYKYLRETLFGQLKELNMRDADIDTIPEGAFECSNSIVARIYLPFALHHLSNRCLCINGEACNFILTGAYPSRGKNVFDFQCNYNKMTIAPENTFCKEVANSIYSINGDTLYHQNSRILENVVDGTKVIAGNALESGLIEIELIIPESVDSLGDRAMAEVLMMWKTGIFEKQPIFVCYPPCPPKLGRDVFEDNEMLAASVIDESFNLYKDSGWNDIYLFRLSVSSITKVLNSKNLEFRFVQHGIELCSNKDIARIHVYNLEGLQVQNDSFSGKNALIELNNRLSNTPLIIRVSFKDGDTETLKIK